MFDITWMVLLWWFHQIAKCVRAGRNKKFWRLGKRESHQAFLILSLTKAAVHYQRYSHSINLQDYHQFNTKKHHKKPRIISSPLLWFMAPQRFFQFNPPANAKPAGPLCEDASPGPASRCCRNSQVYRPLRPPNTSENVCQDVGVLKIGRYSICDWSWCSWCFKIFNETQQRPMAEKMPLFNFTGEDPLKIMCLHYSSPLSIHPGIHMPCHVALLPLKTPASMKASTHRPSWIVTTLKTSPILANASPSYHRKD